MAVNRYELPSQQQVANTYVDMPYKELLLAGQAQQAEYDKIEASRNEWANKQWNNLSPDDELAKAKQAWLESETSKIADLWSKDPRQARQAFKTFERDAVKEFGKFGSIGAMEANYNARAAYEKQIDERIEKGINKVPQKASMMAKFDEEYAKNKGIGGNETGKWNKYNTEDAVGWINPTEWANEKGKGFEASLKSFANYTMSDDGYIYTDKFTGERLTPEELKSGLDYYYAGDPEMQAMIDQGTKYGYASMDMLVNAIEGAKVKYGYERITSEKDIKGDPNYQSKLDQKEKYGNVITGTDVTDTGATPKTNWLGLPVANNYQDEVKVKQQNLQSIDSEINRFQQMVAPGSTATPKSKASALVAIQNLQNQKQQLVAEINTDNQIINSIGETEFSKTFPNMSFEKEKDLTTAITNYKNAENAYTQFVNKYPGSKYTNEIHNQAQQMLKNLDKMKMDIVLVDQNGKGQSTDIYKYKEIVNKFDQYDKNKNSAIQSYHENKVTYTPTLQIIDGKNPEATKIKNHVIGNPNQYNFKRLVNGKMVDYSPSAGAIDSGWLSPNAKTTTEIVNIVADGKNTSQYVVKDASGKVIETYYASPKNPKSVAAVYNDYYDKVGPNGLFFKESTNNPDLHNELLKKTNQLAQTFLSSSTDKDITNEHTFENGTKAIFDVDGATAGNYNLTLYDKAGNVIPMQLPDGTITDFTTTDYTNLFLILNEFEKQQ